MAIDLPPPMPPMLTIPATIVEASQTQGAYIRRVGDYALQLSGSHHLSTAELDQIFSQATTPSEAIILMNSWTHRRGYLLIQYVYTRPVNGVIHVRAVQKTVGKLSGNSSITGYFRDLEVDQTPTRAEFIRYRSQASPHSDRAGLNYEVSYQEQTDNRDTVDLVFTGSPAADNSPWRGALQLGNQGSRFVGRYFANATLSRDFATGTRLAATYQTALPELGEAGEGDDFSHIQLQANQTTRLGFYEIDLQQTEYERRLSDTNSPTPVCTLPLILGQCPLGSGTSPSGDQAFSADIDQIYLRGQQVLAADIDYRLVFFQQLQWVDSTLAPQTGNLLQDESYATLQVGASYERAQSIQDKTFTWKVDAQVRAGLGGDSGTLGTDKTSEGVSIGKRSAEFLLLKPSANISYAFSPDYKFTVSFSSQFSDEQLPQQQQWVLGGVNTMRAFLPGVLVGDTGLYVSTSIVHSAQFANFTIDTAVFAEAGAARYENASGKDFTGKVSPGSASSLADAGVSATLRAWEQLEISAVVARPLSDSNIDSTQLDQLEADFFVVVKAEF